MKVTAFVTAKIVRIIDGVYMTVSANLRWLLTPNIYPCATSRARNNPIALFSVS